MNLHSFNKLIDETPAAPRQPVVFIGHGSPMNAIENNAFTQSLNKLGKDLEFKGLPKAILCVSAHWLTRGTFVNNAVAPPTIHDFGGFPQELFNIQYPAPGAPEMATEVSRLVSHVTQTSEWGLDHGAWTVLRHVFPLANIPVFQLSIDYYKPMSWHYELGAQLNALRDKGVLILGSGNVVHNLEKSFERLMAGNPAAYDWAIEFDTWVKDRILDCNWTALADYQSRGNAGLMSVPSPDHYAPLMYTMGAAKQLEPIDMVYESVEYGGLSMRTFTIG